MHALEMICLYLDSEFTEICSYVSTSNNANNADKSALVQVMAWCLTKAITWTNDDQDVWYHMALLDHNELINT